MRGLAQADKIKQPLLLVHGQVSLDLHETDSSLLSDHCSFASTCMQYLGWACHRGVGQGDKRTRTQDDNNTGTYPLQSERFYAALKGHGAPARLVLLPHESHGAPRRLLGPGVCKLCKWDCSTSALMPTALTSKHSTQADALWGAWTCHVSWGNPGRLVHSVVGAQSWAHP